jgi:hypothetical protein
MGLGRVPRPRREEIMTHPLQKLLNHIGYETRAYSGRGMYGEECLGVEPDDGMGHLMQYVLENIKEVPKKDRPRIAQAFGRMQTDSMGLGTIVYFPGVPYKNEDEEAEVTVTPHERG